VSDQPEFSLPDGVSMTALGVAWVRASESQRPDRLFDDPLAVRFLVAAGWNAERSLAELSPDDERTPALLVLAQSVIVRTRFLDDVLTAAWADGSRQVVILGAGLDTRAFRLPWPSGSRCFELDLPPVLDFKEAALAGSGAAPSCERILVGADLLGDWTGPLLAAGYEPAQPTVWIAEGLLIYFTQAQNDEILTDIGRLSNPGDRLAITFSRPASGPPVRSEPDAAAVARARAVSGLGLLQDPGAVIALWRWDGPADPVAWLAEHGWTAVVFDREERARAYGRPLAQAEHDSAATRTVLIEAHR
jgi:methyltransferase (TIGR00027 family)